MTGSELVEALEKDPSVGYDQIRDELILEQVLEGNVPDFMRVLVPVEVSEGVTVYAAPDYLCVGSDDDFVHVPLNPMTAQRICDAVGAMLPTRKLVDAIWKAAPAKLEPRPMGPDDGFQYDQSMMYTSRFAIHSRWCRDGFREAGYSAGQLTAGHKKDVVICRSVQSPANKKVAIYGWHRLNGRPIQGPQIQDKAHEITYRDYAHGIRLVSSVVSVNGTSDSLERILKDPMAAKAVSDEVPPLLESPRYVTSLHAAPASP